MNMLVKMASSKEVEELRKQFQAIDKDGSNMITAKELTDAINKMKMNMSVSEVNELIE